MSAVLLLLLLAQDVRVEKDVDNLGGDRKKELDLYLPTSAPPEKGYPAVLIIHGGGWTGGDKGAGRDRLLRPAPQAALTRSLTAEDGEDTEKGSSLRPLW